MNFTSVLLENLLADGQPKSRAAAAFAGLENGEYLLEVFRFDAAPIVLHNDADDVFLRRVFS